MLVVGCWLLDAFLTHGRSRSSHFRRSPRGFSFRVGYLFEQSAPRSGGNGERSRARQTMAAKRPASQVGSRDEDARQKTGTRESGTVQRLDVQNAGSLLRA